ncbi:hypothetical protein BT63DRAFT_429313 [Microthyrium microscopicum]|uniref:MI domain-containing protein n=1 Tax=Microthyrium microscopicum TaxID=703497 RepID=A0A6A6TZX2_9PEZI|nr:hypothetical protein BT63DRAFT_429313 [Microthyrium microscopicum]
MNRKNFGAPRLPKDLLDKVDPSGATHKNSKRSLPRKEQRKAARQEKKAARSQPKQYTKRPAVEIREDEEEDFIADPWAHENDDGSDEEDFPQPPKKRVKTTSDTKAIKGILKPAKPLDSTRSPSPPPRPSRAVRDALKQDDSEIAFLEKKLGIKNKKRPKAFSEDGLDELLDGIDDIMGLNEEKPGKNDDNEWLKSKRKRNQILEEHSDEDASEAETDLEEFDGFESEGDLDDEDDLDDDVVASDMDGSNGQDEEDPFDQSDEEIPPPKRVRENPYRAPVPESSAPVQKYIPPSLRGPAKDDQELIIRIKRQLQGLLNKLSENNMLSILKDLEGVLASNPRQHVICTLIDLLIGQVCDRTSHMDTFIILHAGFISAVYKMIGPHFGAQLLERIVGDFNRFYEVTKQKQDGSKETSNLIALLAEIYTFQVINCNLIFDLIRLLVIDLSELDTELLLKLIKNCGPQLRADDATALKDIVILVQKAVTAKGGESKLSVRTKFMIETISNLKNNRIKTIPGSGNSSEHVLRIKKNLKARNFKNTEPLGVGLKDIENATKGGKWWLVGASWNNETKSATDIAQNSDDEANDDYFATQSTDTSVDLLALAKQHRMNTDIRRSIFVTIMSSVDYKDCWMRLRRLHLSKTQQFEIPRVLVYCAGAEGTYNPYYRLVAKKLSSEHKMRKALQFNLWRTFRRCGEKDDLAEDSEGDDERGDETEDEIQLREIVSLARFFGELIAGASLPITVLKILNFVYLQDKTSSFLEVLLVTALQTIDRRCKSNEAESQAAVAQIFSKAKNAPQMVPGLQYFLTKSVQVSTLVSSRAEKAALTRTAGAAVDAMMLLDFAAADFDIDS